MVWETHIAGETIQFNHIFLGYFMVSFENKTFS